MEVVNPNENQLAWNLDVNDRECDHDLDLPPTSPDSHLFLENFGGGLDGLAQVATTISEAAASVFENQFPDQRSKLRERRVPVNYSEYDNGKQQQDHVDSSSFSREIARDESDETEQERPRKKGRPCGTKTEIQKLLAKEECWPPTEDPGPHPPPQPPSNHMFMQERIKYQEERARRKHAGESLEGLKEPERPYSEYRYWLTALVPWLVKRTNWLEYQLSLEPNQRGVIQVATAITPVAKKSPTVILEREAEQQQKQEWIRERDELMRQKATLLTQLQQARQALAQSETKTSHMQSEKRKYEAQVKSLTLDKNVLREKLAPFLERKEIDSERKRQDLVAFRDMEATIKDRELEIRTQATEIHKQAVLIEQLQARLQKSPAVTPVGVVVTSEQENRSLVQQYREFEQTIKQEVIDIGDKFGFRLDAGLPLCDQVRELKGNLEKQKQAHVLMRHTLEQQNRRFQEDQGVLRKRIEIYETSQSSLKQLARRLQLQGMEDGSDEWIKSLETACMLKTRLSFLFMICLRLCSLTSKLQKKQPHFF